MSVTPEQKAEKLMAMGPVWLVREVIRLEEILSHLRAVYPIKKPQ